MSKSLAIIAAVATFSAGLAFAENRVRPTTDSMTNTMTTTNTMSTTEFLTTMPENTLLISNIYDQKVYDPSENKIGDIKDIMVDRSGVVRAVIVSVGGFLGMGEKDVAVPMDAVNVTQRNNKSWLTMNTTKDALKSATGFKFDKSRGLWTIGSN